MGRKLCKLSYHQDRAQKLTNKINAEERNQFFAGCQDFVIYVEIQ